ncbi:ATP-dependent DNA helicase srs2 [Lecanicillium sp. MT-2017a]|nr:ATP-dependent DNA helicase srs2 [Lecanicillium sp. MT-2017a]
MAATTTPDILASLNKAQLRAVTSPADTVAILAGPGSGKTHTLTSRVVWLIQHAGYRPSDIIVATFTVKAAREMKERIGKHLGQECQKKIVLGTFHSIARRYLATYGKHIGLNSKFGIADDNDSKAIIQRICKRHKLAVEPGMARGWISKKKSKGNLEPKLGANGKPLPDMPDLKICFDEYQEQLSRSNLLDYDDLLTRCVELLRAYPPCVANVQSVLVDEYQDTNGVQYDLMKLFAQQRQRITIVGDPDQSIYGWRSAEIKNLYRLLREFPQTDEISLEENYRSSQSILSVSLSVIQQDQNRYKKVLLPVHNKCTSPVLRRLYSAADEGEWIVSEIKRAMLMFGGMLKGEDFAILIRSAFLSRHVETALGKQGVAYRMIGGHKFYERKEIKLLLDYLRVVHQPDNNDSVSRIINVPRRGIGEATIKALLEEAEQQKVTLWSLLWNHCRGGKKSARIRPSMEKKLGNELLPIISSLQKHLEEANDDEPPLIELIQRLITKLDYETYLNREFPEDHEQRWASVQEFVNLAADFVRDFGDVDEDALPGVEDAEQAVQDSILGRFLANIALASDAQKNDEDGDGSSLVTISTIHAAKGLEWPVVFIPCVYEGSLPHSRAEDLDEERRLLYVAMTRAKTFLYLSCPFQNSFGNMVDLSSFVVDLEDEAFAEKGPSFDRPVVEGAAKILNRQAPTEKAVYDNLPILACTEDDLFPTRSSNKKANRNLSTGAAGLKRQRIGTGCSVSSEPQWHRDYTTTMQAGQFTAAALPGFTTAGEHHTTLSTTALQETNKNIPKKGTTKRKHDQHSLLGFVTSETSTHAAPPIPQYPSVRPAGHGVPQPAMDPGFAAHRLPAVGDRKKLFVPPLPDEGKWNQYACFSSSPGQPTSPTQQQQQPQPPSVPAPSFSRPAASTHATTFQAVKYDGEVRKPAGLGPPPSMNKVREPFKPLTLNKPARRSR